MAKKTATETIQKPKPLDPEAVRAVCQLKADERLDLHRRIDKESENVMKRTQELNEQRRKADEAARDAEEAVNAHRSYKDHLPAREYDAELKRLTKEKDAAKKESADIMQRTQVEFAKLRKPLDALQKQADELARQWKFHVKRAEESGVDIDEFWTPEKGVPPESVADEE